MKPFLKWAGNKQSIIDEILRHLPSGDRLIEPFMGSAAVYLATNYDAGLLNDINEDLVRVFEVLKEQGPEFIETCRGLFTPEHNTEERYYELRDEFNELQAEMGALDQEALERRAALFVYLNRHGFNGLCRYNQSGGFNVPYGRYKSPSLPAKRMRGFWRKAQHATFTCIDFEAVMDHAEPGDVVYCDPPYIPLSATSSFTGYAKGGFGPVEQERLARKAEELAGRGVPVIISNHDVPAARALYEDAAYIHDFPVQRYISATGDDRKKVREIVAVFGVEEERTAAMTAVQPEHVQGSLFDEEG